MAFELTSRRVTSDFFAAHTVRDLEQHSDYWLEEQGRLTEPLRYDAASDHYVPIACLLVRRSGFGDDSFRPERIQAIAEPAIA